MKCLFCRNSSENSKSIEHIIPESLGNVSGNHELPRGIVCDSCNNYFSRSIEAPVLNHQSFQNIRAKYLMPTKKNKFPILKGYALNTDIEVGVKLSRDKSKLDIIALKGSQESDFERLKRLDVMGIRRNILEFPMTMDPPQKEMSRLLAKMALETLFLRISQSTSVANACDVTSIEHYNNIRNWARYGHNFENWPYHYRQYAPEETMMKHPDNGRWIRFGFGHDLLLTKHPETFYVFSYSGYEFTINLGGPAIKGYELWLEENNHVSFLIEKKGHRIQQVMVDDEPKYYLVPLILQS